ncbi:MAG: hypothetical protein ACI9KE_001680, partial [Polyangiales bacterium]
MTFRFTIAVCLGGLIFASGCARKGMRAFTAGETGCTEDEVVLVEVDRGFSSMSWVAECRGQHYVCSQPGCSPRQRPVESEARVEDIRRVRTISPRQALTFATTEGDIRAVRARLVTVDSEMSLTVGPRSTDEVSVEVRTTTRVPLSACENVVFRRGDSVVSAQLEGGRAQFPLATLSRVFNVSSRETTAARFCGRVLRIGIAEAQLFSQLEENIPRIGSADTSGGEE